MAITVADNFSYQGKKPLDGRDTFATLAAMKAYAEASVYDGCLSYCDEDGKRYEFKSTNTVDPTTGKWREYSSGGGGETYSDFTGATSSTAGAHGLVPAPSAGDESKVLFGNGLWGALPSVDLSVLSNEAFILDANEKVIGMTANRKLLYQRYVEKTTPNSSSLVSLFSEQNLENCYFAGGYFVDVNGYDVPINRYEDGVTDVGVSIKSDGTQMYFGVGTGSSDRPARFIIRYTKTTDSPLPAGVKFAGVWYDGSVVLEKTVDYGSTVAIPNSGFTSIGMDASNIRMILYAYGYHTDDARCCPLIAIKENNLVKCITARAGAGMELRYFTIRYTLAS